MVDLTELKIIVDKEYYDIRFDHDPVTCDDEELDLKDSSKLLKMEAHCNSAGDYVIIADEKVISHGKSLMKLLNDFKARYPDKTPKIAKIPEEDALIPEIKNDNV